jgi:hypothetical protein
MRESQIFHIVRMVEVLRSRPCSQRNPKFQYLQEFSKAIPALSTTSDPPDMADQDAAASQNKPAGSAGPAAAKPPRPPNPVFKMMGAVLCFSKFHLPSSQ